MKEPNKSRISDFQKGEYFQRKIAMYEKMFALVIAISFSSIGFLHAESPCISDQYINGCSVPFKGNFPYEKRFKPACDRHDVCYRCGIVYHWTRTRCDNGFLKDMLEICNNRYNGGSGVWNAVKFKVCNGAAKSYHQAVHLLGSKRFRNVILPWCSADPCVERNGRPSVKK